MPEKTITKEAASSGKLTFWQKGFWSIGAGASNIMSNAHGYLAMPIYQLALGVDPTILGIAMGISRLVDAITDPIVGHLSDNTRSRFGRRRPYMFIGAILSTFLFILMWMPPVFLGTGGIAMYFLVVSILYYISYAVFSIPWGALGFELSEDYNERTKVQAFSMFVSAVSGLFLGAMWKLSMLFGKNEIEGVRIVGFLFGGIILITALIPAITSREKVSVQKQKKISFKTSLAETVKNGPFMKLSVVVLLLFLGIFLVNPFALYININYVFAKENKNIAIENVEKLQQVIQAQGAEKIIDAVSSQRVGEIAERLALVKADEVAKKLSIKGADKDSFEITPQDLNLLKEEVTEKRLSETLNGLVIKNLKKNYGFYDIRRVLKRSAVVKFIDEVDFVCAGNLGLAETEIKNYLDQGKDMVNRIDKADKKQLAVIEAEYSKEKLENVMATASYVLSKDMVSTFNFWGNVAFQGALLLSIPAVTWVSARIGKKRAFMGGLVIVGLAFAASWLLYTPKVPYLQMVCLSCIGVGLSSIFMLSGSIIADICDIDELKTGRRREGIFGAMFAWVCKAGMAGTLILSGFMLTWSGYSSSAIYRFQPDSIVTLMRQMYMIVPVVTATIAFIIMLITPISEKKMYAVRAELNTLKAAGKLIAKDE